MLWQFAPTKKFDAADFGKFLELLPAKLDGRKLRHVVEVRHASFCVPEFIALVREFATPVVFAEHEKYPGIADPVGDFVYARLQKGEDDIPTAYPPKALDAWAECAAPVGQGRDARATCRSPTPTSQGESHAARRVRLLHPRGQGARAGRGHGADRAVG